jgi:hypothetical protein
MCLIVCFGLSSLGLLAVHSLDESNEQKKFKEALKAVVLRKKPTEKLSLNRLLLRF